MHVPHCLVYVIESRILPGFFETLGGAVFAAVLGHCHDHSGWWDGGLFVDDVVSAAGQFWATRFDELFAKLLGDVDVVVDVAHFASSRIKRFSATVYFVLEELFAYLVGGQLVDGFPSIEHIRITS